MTREPAALIGAVATILSALYGYFFAGSGDDALKVHEFLLSLVPLVAALITRSQVTPATSHRV